MYRNQKKISVSGVIVFLLSILNAVVLEQGLVVHNRWYWLLFITLPLLLFSVFIVSNRHSDYN